MCIIGLSISGLDYYVSFREVHVSKDGRGRVSIVVEGRVIIGPLSTYS